MTDRKTLDQMNSDDLDQLHDALDRARALHQPMLRGVLTVCGHCSHWDEHRQRCFGVLTDWPCPTTTALGQPKEQP